MTNASASRETIRPTLHHFGLTTANLEAMVGWYAEVLGMAPNHRSSTPSGAQIAPGLRAAWVTNDGANHRVAIMELPGLTDDPQRSRHHRLQHVAFELPTIDDLLATYARLKGLGIEPVLTADHGATTAFYYQDPDRNSVELTVDNFGDWEKSSEWFRFSTYASRAITGNLDWTTVREISRRRRFVTGQQELIEEAAARRTDEHGRESGRHGKQEAVRQMLARLSDRERGVIVSRFGREGAREKTLRRLARINCPIWGQEC